MELQWPITETIMRHFELDHFRLNMSVYLNKFCFQFQKENKFKT